MFFVIAVFDEHYEWNSSVTQNYNNIGSDDYV